MTYTLANVAGRACLVDRDAYFDLETVTDRRLASDPTAAVARLPPTKPPRRVRRRAPSSARHSEVTVDRPGTGGVVAEPALVRGAGQPAAQPT